MLGVPGVATNAMSKREPERRGLRLKRGLRSNDVKNHDKKITCCFYLKKAETFLLLMFFNFSP